MMFRNGHTPSVAQGYRTKGKGPWEDDYIESEKDASEKYEYQEYVWHNTALVTSKNKEQWLPLLWGYP